MKLENIVFAVAAKIDVDRSFVFEYVVCRHIQSILLKHTALPSLAIDDARHDYADSVELQWCIDRAAHLFLGDLVRASEMCEAAIARWQLTFET
ncbi:MAG: hypothetical protein QFE16_01685 [Pseudomonadota bacterium]|jgi:hypothetical protein|nr:hypothetical protein [Pseudomonadota bacterium]